MSETNAGAPGVDLARVLNARPDAVFDAWITPEIMRRWLFRSPHNEILEPEVDARAGGRFSIRDRAGGEEIDHFGTFETVDRPRRLVFTLEVPRHFPGVSRVTVDLEPTTDGSLMRFTQTGVEREVTQGAWRDMFELLARELGPTGAPETSAAPHRTDGAFPADARANHRNSDAGVAELIERCHAWDRAMIGNHADTIGRFMADDWAIVGSDGRVSDKAAFLALIRSGALTHDVMQSEELDVRLYGDTGVVTARGISAGKYRQRKFREAERASNVFVRHGGEWMCVLTHLSRLDDVTGR